MIIHPILYFFYIFLFVHQLNNFPREKYVEFFEHPLLIHVISPIRHKLTKIPERFEFAVREKIMYPFFGRPQEVKNCRPESRNVAVVSIVTRFSAITNVIVATVTHGEANAVVLTRVGTATCIHEAKLPSWPYKYGHLKNSLSCSSKTRELNPDWTHFYI